MRSLLLAGALVLLPACNDAPTAPEAGPESPGPQDPATFGLVEITLTGLGGGDDVQASVLSAPDATSLEALRRSRSAGPGDPAPSGPYAATPSRVLTPPDFSGGGGDGTLQLEPLSTGSFTDGERGSGGVRYLWATFWVRNAEADGSAYDTPRENLTFLAVDTDGTIGETAVTRLARFSGAPAPATLAEELMPTGQVHRDATGVIVSTGPDVLQAITEAEAAAVTAPAGVTDVFPYGFVVRSTAGDRVLGDNPASDEFDGVVTFAFKLPLQASAADDPFTISMMFHALDDTETRLTEAPSEQGTTTGALQARADALPGSSVTLLGNSTTPITGHTVRRICTVRTAGSDPGNPAATLVDVPGCDVLPANVRVVDTDAAVGGDGTDWATPFNTLQDALDCARFQSGAGGSCEGVEELWVAEGAYYPDESDSGDTDAANAHFLLIEGLALYGGFEGTEIQRGERDPESHVTILSGDVTQDDQNADANSVAESTADIVGPNSGQLLNADGRSTPITRATIVDGFTITAAQASGLICRGGGATGGCSPTLRNVGFSGNASPAGGAVNGEAITGGTFAPLFEDVTFTGNASANNGGAVRAIANGGGTTAPVFVRVAFHDNTALTEGGAIAIDGDDAGTTILYNTIFEGNATTNGGMHGGAIAVDLADVEIVNTVFHDNQATGNGGALHLIESDATLINVTVAGNRADSDDDGGEGGGVYVGLGSVLTLGSSIVWGNSDGAPSAVVVAGGSGTANWNTIEGGCPVGLTCIAAHDVDPLFVDLAGGDLHLQDSSPAIDQGDNSAIPIDAYDVDADGIVLEGLPVDLDGLPRTFDWMGDDGSAIVDRGAYEKS